MPFINTTRYQIAEYWNKHHDQFVIDLGEPSCFACGYWDEKWDRPIKPEDRWNRAKLERAHIVARSIGGEDVPSNYLLLCSRCHVLAPMTNKREWMLRWVETQEGWMNRLVREGVEEFRRLGGTDEDARLVIQAGKQEWLDVWNELKIDSHPENRCALSSMAVFALEVARQNSSSLPKAA